MGITLNTKKPTASQILMKLQNVKNKKKHPKESQRGKRSIIHKRNESIKNFFFQLTPRIWE